MLCCIGILATFSYQLHLLQSQLESTHDLAVVKSLEEQERAARIAEPQILDPQAERALSHAESELLHKIHAKEAVAAEIAEQQHRVAEGKHDAVMAQLESKADLNAVKTLEEQERIERVQVCLTSRRRNGVSIGLTSCDVNCAYFQVNSHDTKQQFVRDSKCVVPGG
jgi:hypothetical protein